jgi:hypothetical protein
MKSLPVCGALLLLFALSAPTTLKPYYVTTVETRRYVEPEVSPEVWLASLFTVFFAFWLSEKLAPQYVETQEDIESYTVTVKIKKHLKTVDEETFTARDYDDVIEQALDFAQKNQGENHSLVFKPSITVAQKKRPYSRTYSLDVIRKPTLPSRPDRKEEYWQRLERSLTRTFLVPERAPAPQQTHVTHTHHHVREVEYVVVPQTRYSSFWFF